MPKLLDADGIHLLIDHFAEQALSAYKIPLPFSKISVSKGANYVVCGMGGSSFTIDILRDMMQDGLHIYTSRTYSLPRETNEKSFVCISSYSGNTEEALSCYQEARKRKLPMFVIGAGGTLLAWAERDGVPLIRIAAPGVTQPRYSTGYQLGYHLRVLHEHGLISDYESLLKKTVRESKNFGLEKTGRTLARSLHHRVPLLYVDSLYYSVARVGSIKIQENSKTLVHWNLLPEMNHNEMNGFLFSRAQAKFAAVFLESPDSHPRVLKRIKITEQWARRCGMTVHRFVLPGTSRFSRMVAGITLLDWTSFYLAQLNGIDPSPVDMVEKFKKTLG